MTLYGLKQSPKQWYKHFDDFIPQNGFDKSKFDSYIYVKKKSKMMEIYLLLYVDDVLLVNRDEVGIERRES